MLMLTSQSHSVFSFSDPKHCQECYTIGYRDGFNEAQSGLSPVYAYVGHSESWWSGFKDGFRAGNGGTNIFYGQRSDRTANIHVRGDNNKIIVNQHNDNQIGDNGFTSGHQSTSGFYQIV